MSSGLRCLKIQILFRKSIQSDKDDFDEISHHFSYSQLYPLKSVYWFDWNLSGFGQIVFSGDQVNTEYANILFFLMLFGGKKDKVVLLSVTGQRKERLC